MKCVGSNSTGILIARANTATSVSPGYFTNMRGPSFRSSQEAPQFGSQRRGRIELIDEAKIFRA
jgi:hypothetical protein